MMPESPGSGGSTPRRRDVWMCIALAAVTLATYFPVRHFDFIQFDDPYYPLNPHLRDGWTWDAVKWAFTTGAQGNWHPLTWLSHLLDTQLYGPQPGPAHVTGVLIHIVASLALFAFLRRATGTFWRSGFVAFLFALHPLHVESVAWISERKDVLCAFFWFLTSWLWVRYGEKPSAGRYLTVLPAFCLGLLSKPMIVTLPFVLLLLDFWPLRRKLGPRLLWEKLPFLGLAAVDSAVTFLVQSRSGSVRTLEAFPLGLRIENALITWVIYIGKTFWPSNLPFWYPYPKSIPVWQAVAAALALTGVSAGVLLARRTRPWLAVGWFWYLGTLVPVIGLVQVGMQARADRYMYVPMVGLGIMVAWSAAAAAERRRRLAPWIAAALAAACVAMVPATWIQLQYWKDNETLFSHAVQVSEGNYIAYHNLGVTLTVSAHRLQQALDSFDKELKSDPKSAEGHTDRGATLWRMGRKGEAIEEYRTALGIDPRYQEAHINLGAAMADAGRWDEAISEYRAALAINPRAARALFNLGVALMTTGHTEEAIVSLDHAVAAEPDSAEAHNNLGAAIAKQGHWNEAILEFDAAVRCDPSYGAARRNLGQAQLKVGRLHEAVESLRAAARLNPPDAETYNMIGFALADIPGQMQGAVEAMRQAVEVDPNYAVAQENLGRLLARDPATLREAIAHIEAAQRISPSASTLQYLNRLKAATEQGR
jgi:tetratricopeptide (TPR) repeat protein